MKIFRRNGEGGFNFILVDKRVGGISYFLRRKRKKVKIFYRRGGEGVRMKCFECFKAVDSNKRWKLRCLNLKIFNLQTEVKVVNLFLLIRQ
jgi:hypothetical protein